MNKLGVIVVTYNSGDEIDSLLDSIAPGAPTREPVVVVVDNSSTDDTLERVARHAGVEALRSGGNLGYAAGINVARAHLARRHPDLEAVAVLNPDLVVRPGALDVLVDALSDEIGVTVPVVKSPDGRVFHSLRREATLVSQLGDAAFGASWPNRPAALSDTLRRPDEYQSARDVEWASGAALVVSAACDAAVGAWREDFFLYSEETDFARRVHDAGYRIRFVPEAVVEHIGGASGSSPQLEALLNVNKLRYYASHHSVASTAAYRAILATQFAARSWQPGARETVRRLVDQGSWKSLPHAVPDAAPQPTSGSVVIPAHNEATVIGRLLDRLQGLSPDIEVVVVSNGSTDDTVGVANQHRGSLNLTVIDSPVASKQQALNLGDQTVGSFPRAYVDADIEVGPEAIHRVFHELTNGPWLVARPCFVYETDDCDHVVQAFYRARSRTPQLMDQMWGAGFFAVSAEGRSRWTTFPLDVGDDWFVNSLFTEDDKVVVRVDDPIVVHVPRTVAALRHTLRRVYRSSGAHSEATQPDGRADTHLPSAKATLRSLVRANVSRPWDVLAYSGVALLARLNQPQPISTGNRDFSTWERDGTSR